LSPLPPGLTHRDDAAAAIVFAIEVRHQVQIASAWLAVARMVLLTGEAQ
jgi:hypothetical protein